ncbi:MAG TPA: YihY/virulence factor BrkB family protein [Armatimonadota bacterium]|jgi:membrane protein
MPGRNNWRNRWAEFRSFAKEVITRFGEDRVSLAAGAISFFTLLSLFPLVLLAVTIAAREYSAQLTNLASLLGPEIYKALHEQILSTVQHTGTSTVVAVVFALWSGSQIFLILESAVNSAWHAKRARPFLLRRGLAILMVIIGGVLLAVTALLVNMIRFLASLRLSLWGYQVRELPGLISLVLTIIIPLLLVTAMFAIAYRILPTKRVTLRTVLPGAVSAGALWLISLHAFSWYAAWQDEHYHVVYGSLAGVILLLFWFYYSAFTFLLGAEMSAVYHRRLAEAGNREERGIDESEDAADATQQRRQQERMEQETQSMVYYGYQQEDEQK